MKEQISQDMGYISWSGLNPTHYIIVTFLDQYIIVITIGKTNYISDGTPFFNYFLYQFRSL